MPSFTTIQNSLSAGELSPSLLGRTDVKKYGSGTSTCRNFFANYRGGVSSRAGLAYVGMCKQSGTAAPPRDIPFQFSLNQGYVLEFGDQYMRIKSDGAYVTETSKVVTSVNLFGVFTVASHGYSVGDWIYNTGNDGFSGLTWIVRTVISANAFTVEDLFGNDVTSATPSGAGTVARIYTVVAPYAAVDLPYLKYTQSADVMTLTCVNTSTNTEYPPYNLARLGNTNWVFTQQTFSANISAPGTVTATAFSSTTKTTYYGYVVTAVSSETGEESVASDAVFVLNNDISVYVGSNTLSWAAVDGADSYNIYASTPAYSTTVPVSSLYGFIGSSLGPSFVDTNITPDFTIVPPVHRDPFALGAIEEVEVTAAGTNYSQSTIGWSVTTSTGTDFDGFPVVANGSLKGFVVTNHGEGYDPADTITFTDSGGGVATGTLTWVSNPADGENITLNSFKYTFRNNANAADEVEIQATLALTLENLANVLNAQNVYGGLSISVAYYTYSSTVLTITYKTPGSVGNAYTLAASAATRSGATLTGGGTAGSGATADLVIGPEEGTYPGVAAYFQQRRVYAASLNEPDTYWMTQPGLFNNMDSSIPVTDADSITGTPWAQQVNGIQFLVPMPGGLIVFTGRGVWQVSGGASAAITPSNQTAVPQAYNGSVATVPPIAINEDILHVQSKGYTVRDLQYNFYNNIYTGTDLTVLSDHLFIGYEIVQWAWAQEPYKLIWVVRNDGQMLCLTYLKEQEVFSWTRHDTNGLFVGVCSVTEPPIDAVYVIVKRYVQGAWRYYSERMDNRVWENTEDSFCVDSGLRSALTYPDATLTPSGITGEITLTASSGVFTLANEGDIIRVDNGKVTVTNYVSTTVVEGTVTEDLTAIVTDDPDERPLPAASGEWSISTPTTTVSGLNHLEGLEVAIVADGSVVENQTVEDGTITLEVEASNIVVGLPYLCQVQTMYIDIPSPNTVQNKRKNITSVGVRVQGTRGLSIGSDQPDQSFQQNNEYIPWTNMSELKERNPTDYMGVALPLYTGDYYKNISSQWAVEGQVALEQSYPLPANILALVSYWVSGDDA